MNTKAGTGEHHVYRIRSGGGGGKLPTPGLHYIGIEAVAWFINRQSSWFSNKMASGVLSIELANGLEEYQAALGTFDLKEGARFAPVFEKPVLPDRSYRGGPITLRASLTGIKKDTVLAGLLKSASNASLGIVAGMVETASLAGPTKLLGSAGAEIVKGVQDVLTKTGDDRVPLFDFSGLQYGIRQEELDEEETYLILHRGADLDESNISVKREGQLLLPFYRGAALTDGAWLMLRIRKSTEYSGVRPWFDVVRGLRSKIQSLVSDVTLGVRPKEDAFKEFLPTFSGDRTIYDMYSELRAIIQNDGVLSEVEAGVFVGQLTAALGKATDDINKAQPGVFATWVDSVRIAVTSGNMLPDETAGIIANEIRSVAEYRHMIAPEFEQPKWVEKFEASNVQGLMVDIPRTLDINFGEM